MAWRPAAAYMSLVVNGDSLRQQQCQHGDKGRAGATADTVITEANLRLGRSSTKRTRWKEGKRKDPTERINRGKEKNPD